MVIAAEVDTPVTRLTVDINRLDDGRARIIQDAVTIGIDILGKGPGEVVTAYIETIGPLVENIACGVREVCEAARNKCNQ